MLCYMTLLVCIFNAGAAEIQTEDKFSYLLDTMGTVLGRLAKMEADTSDLRNENAWLKRTVLNLMRDSKTKAIKLDKLKNELEEKEQWILAFFEQRQYAGQTSDKGNIKPMLKDEPGTNIQTVHVHTEQTMDKTDKEHGIKQRVKDVNQEKRLLINSQPVKPTSEPTRAAFSVHGRGTMNILSNTQPIVFDTVDDNVGNHYDTISGMFVCPVSGHYFFTATFTAPPATHMNAELVKNGARLAAVYAGDTSNVYEASTLSSVTHCKQGEHVWLKLLSAGPMKIYGDNHSGFEGFILWEDKN